MKIGQFSDTFLPVVDGVGRVVNAYAQALCERGHECYVVTPMSDAGYRGQYPFDIVDYYGIHLMEHSAYKVGLPQVDAHYTERMKRIKLDLIHVHSPFVTGNLGLHLAKKRNIPTVGTIHSKYYDDFLQVLKVPTAAAAGVKIVAEFYERCDEVWAVSGNSAEVLRDYGFEGDIRIMRNGAEIRKPVKKNIEKVKKMHDLDGYSVVLYVGQMNWKKNIKKILEAVSIPLKKGRNIKLVMAGQGPHEKEITELAKSLGIKDRVLMVGHISDISVLDGLYGASDILAFPSIYDNGPMVVREAASMGTPSLLVKNSSAAEGITDGYNGILCTDDSNDMALILERVLFEQPGLLKQVGKNAKSTIVVSWNEVIKDVESVYSELIEKKRKNSIEKPKKAYF